MDYKRQEEIAELIHDMDLVVSFAKEKLRAAEEKRPFVIVVCGAFSTGKTSLINVLLGSDLPTGINPVTKSVTKLRYGEKVRCILLASNDTEEKEITLEEARKIILNKEKDTGYLLYQLMVELPSPFLKKGVILVDTPGFEDDEKEKLDEISKKAIEEADFCLVNFSCNRFGTQAEREFLDELQSMTSGNFVSVLNCMNYLMQAGQFEDLEKRAMYILEDYGNEKIGSGRYFMVDTKERDYADLGGMDCWPEELLEEKAKLIQKETPLSMALWQIRKVTRKCNKVFQELLQEIHMRKQPDVLIQQEKRVLQDAARVLSEKATELHQLQMEIRMKKMNI